MKKRLLAVLLTLTLCVSCFAACDLKNDSDRDDLKHEKNEETTAEKATLVESEENSQESSVDETTEDESVSETTITSLETSLEISSEISSEIPSDTFEDDTATEYETTATETEGAGSEETSGEESSDNAETSEFEFVSVGDGTCFVSAYLGYDATNVVIPDFSPDGEYVTVIGEHAFSGMSSIVSVTLPKYIKRIEYQAFYGCSSLESINLPDSLAYLSKYAFEECTSLLETEGSAVYVGQWVVDCKQPIINVTLREGTVSIADDALDLDGIASVCLPESLRMIGDNAFSEYGTLATIYYYGDPEQWESLKVDYSTNEALKNAEVIFVKSLFSDCADSEGLEFVSRGDGTCILAGIGECGDDYVIIPSISPLGDVVTAIGENAFERSKIKGVRIPHTVVTIGDKAFSECDNLKIVRMSDNLKMIGDMAFYYCGNLEYINVPSGIEHIGSYAFYECDFIISNVYENIHYLGNREDPYLIALRVNNKTLETYTVHNETKFISAQLFGNCNEMKNVEIPEGVKSIGSSAFYRCYGLKSVSLPEGLIYLGNYAFDECTGLESITIPKSIKAINNSTFSGCVALESIVIPEGLTYIGEYAFSDCEKLTSICIPDTLEYIGNNVFSGCYDLVFNEHNNISYLGNDENKYLVAYDICGELEDRVGFAEGVRVIAPYAFYSSEGVSFAYLHIPESVVYIGDSAFSRCTSLETIVVDPNNAVYASQGNCLIDIQSKTLILGCKNSVIPSDGSVMIIGQNAFGSVTEISSLVIPEGVTHIGTLAFSGCYGLESVSLPGTLLSVGELAFSGCNKLEELEIPESVIFIGRDAFSGCNDLIERVGDMMVVGDWLVGFYNYNAERVTVDGCIKGIAANAFDHMTYLYSLTLPESIAHISDDAFVNCERLIEVCNLTEMDIKAGSSDFGGVALYAKNVYGKDAGRSRLVEKDGFVIFEGEKDQVSYVIAYVGSDIQLVIPDAVGENGYEIYMYAFNNRTDIVSVTLRDGATAIGKYAFFGCTSLVAINLPDSIQSIGERAFSGCASLLAIRIPEKVTVIGLSTFDSCESLEKVIICASEISFKMYSFSGCSSLESMVIHSLSIGIEMSVFSGCSSLKTIYYTTDGLGMAYTPTGNSYFLDAEKVHNYSPVEGE